MFSFIALKSTSPGLVYRGHGLATLAMWHVSSFSSWMMYSSLCWLCNVSMSEAYYYPFPRSVYNKIQIPHIMEGIIRIVFNFPPVWEFFIHLGYHLTTAWLHLWVCGDCCSSSNVLHWRFRSLRNGARLVLIMTEAKLFANSKRRHNAALLWIRERFHAFRLNQQLYGWYWAFFFKTVTLCFIYACRRDTMSSQEGIN